MFSVYSDQEKNRLYIILGEVTPEEAAMAAAAVKENVKRLVRGFTVLTDLTEYKAVSQKTAERIKEAQDYLVSRGMGKTVRISRSVLPIMQFERVGKITGMGAETARSIDEAESILDEWVQSRIVHLGGKSDLK